MRRSFAAVKQHGDPDHGANASVKKRRKSGPATLGANASDSESEDEVEQQFGGGQPSVVLIRAPIMPFLVVDKSESIIFRPFRSPLQGHNPGQTDESKRRTLGVRVKRGGVYSQPRLLPIFKSPPKVDEAPDPGAKPFEPLVLWKPAKEDNGDVPIQVDPTLAKWLRQHQREGVQFMFDCLMGLRRYPIIGGRRNVATSDDENSEMGNASDFIEGFGCILADDMGLGKTLQSITVMWTLLKQGFGNSPTIRKAIVVCPSSLVKNWAAEIEKWLEGKCPCTAVAENSKDKVVSHFEGFKYDRRSMVIISSYETFRIHVERLKGCPIDLIICDEAHRLKDSKTKTAIAICSLPAKRRLLLSGTPIQNDLDEFYSLVSICNPDVLGDAQLFRKHFVNAILVGREPGAAKSDQERAGERLAELSNITNLFILRRTNNLLAKVLPPKIVMNIFCKMTPLQEKLYSSFLRSSACRKILQQTEEGGAAMTGRVLSSIQTLMKLCNHPLLIRGANGQWPPAIKEGGRCDEVLDEIEQQRSAAAAPQATGGSRGITRTGGSAGRPNYPPSMSGKVLLLLRLLQEIRRTSRDRVVLISNYTQTLDLFERLSKYHNFPACRLDGSTTIKKRHQLVLTFNDPTTTAFLFLLSSKAGGCGINLIGANRLVMFDPDWNPANDKQALARVWRDGQKKSCYIYRLFSTGTIEEKIYQRQICKDGLSTMIVGEEGGVKDSLSSELVKDLFTLRNKTDSDTHDMLGCVRCFGNSLPIAMSRRNDDCRSDEDDGSEDDEQSGESEEEAKVMEETPPRVRQVRKAAGEGSGGRGMCSSSIAASSSTGGGRTTRSQGFNEVAGGKVTASGGAEIEIEDSDDGDEESSGGSDGENKLPMQNVKRAAGKSTTNGEKRREVTPPPEKGKETGKQQSGGGKTASPANPLMADCRAQLEADGMVPQLEADGFNEDDLLTWAHHRDVKTVDDGVFVVAASGGDGRTDDGQMKTSGRELVSFVMSCRIDFAEETPPSPPRPDTSAKALDDGRSRDGAAQGRVEEESGESQGSSAGEEEDEEADEEDFESSDDDEEEEKSNNKRNQGKGAPALQALRRGLNGRGRRSVA